MRTGKLENGFEFAIDEEALDDMELLALTDTNTANINSMNEMLAELGYPIT